MFIKMGSNLSPRCIDTEQARRLVRAGEGVLVEGVEEEQYWAKIKKDCDNEIELAMMELEKSNTDRQMLRH